MLKDKPLVSVIMNCHNGSKFLKQSVNSVISQTYKNWELIFWDNVSQDESIKIISQFPCYILRIVKKIFCFFY